MTPTPGAAVMWTFLVPGLAHLRLGKTGRAVTALATTTLLFWLGYSMLGWGQGSTGRLWFYSLFTPLSFLQPVLSLVPVQLVPESANLGNAIVAAFLRPSETGIAAHTIERLMRTPSEFQHLGSFLTAASGMLNIFWAVDAHWLAGGEHRLAGGDHRLAGGDHRSAGGEHRLAGGKKVQGASPSRAAFLSWVVPGLGHWQTGQRDKGLLMGAAVLLLFALGLLLSAGHAVDRGLQPVWWVGQVLCGGGTLFASMFTAPLDFTSHPAFFDLGLVLCTTAGLLNLVVIIDAYTVAEQGENVPAREASA